MTTMPEAKPEGDAERHRIVDLFAGPGGLDVAASWLGIPTEGIEWDGGACETRAAAKLATRRGDVRKFHPSDFPCANVLAAGPPCQTFTVAGNGAGRRALDEVLRFVKRMSAGEVVTDAVRRLEDERTGLVLEPLNWILSAHSAGRPYDAVILEQVPAVLPVWEAMEEALQGIGYKTRSRRLYAEEYGVPQTRRRAILIANRHFQPELTEPTHQQYRRAAHSQTNLSNRRPCVSIGDALSLAPGSRREYEFEVISNYGSGGDPRARGRRKHSEPAATVTGKVTRNRIQDRHGNYHGRFTPSEMGLLQTFPHDYPWTGTDISQQIGNAIPPRLAAHVVASALGLTIRPEALDATVAMSWQKSAGGLV